MIKPNKQPYWPSLEFSSSEKSELAKQTIPEDAPFTVPFPPNEGIDFIAENLSNVVEVIDGGVVFLAKIVFKFLKRRIMKKIGSRYSYKVIITAHAVKVLFFHTNKVTPKARPKKGFFFLNRVYLWFTLIMTRSVWKGPFCEVSLKQTEITRVWSRRSLVLPTFVDRKFQVYNGKTYITLKVTEKKIGHKFGEFANTRKKPIHKKKTKKKKGK